MPDLVSDDEYFRRRNYLIAWIQEARDGKLDRLKSVVKSMANHAYEMSQQELIELGELTLTQYERHHTPGILDA